MTETCCVMVRLTADEREQCCDEPSILVIEGNGYCRQHIQDQFRKSSRNDQIKIVENSVKKEVTALFETCKRALQFITNDTIDVNAEMVESYIIKKIKEKGDD